MDWLDRSIHYLRERNWLSVLAMLLYVAVVAFIVKKGAKPLLLAPGILLAGAFVLYRDARLLWWAGVAMLPAAIELDELSAGSGPSLSLPSDIVAMVLLLVVVLRANYFGQLLYAVRKHPLVWLFALWMLWMLLTSITAVQPLVGIKFWLNSLWYFAAFFVFSLAIFKADLSRYRTWLWVSAPVLIMVLFITVGTHALSGFSFLASYRHMQPFYIEHTVYAASIAIYLVGFFFLAIESRLFSRVWWAAWGMSGLLSFAFITSYVRGAWGSVVIALAAWLLAKYWKYLKIPFFVILIAIPLTTLYITQNDIDVKSTNRKKRSLVEHLQSAFDTETNLSNMERINRWVAAVDMTKEKPIVGYGPGGYAFEFAPYQRAMYKTPISQMSRNTIGTAHNEILRFSTEMGIPGALLYVLLMVVSVWRGMRGYRLASNPRVKTAYAIAFTSLITYYVHGLVNNYYGMDKITVPFFMMLALIAVLDVYYLTPRPVKTVEGAGAK